MPKYLIASWTCQSFEKQYVLRTFLALRLRSVPLCRSMNAVLISRLTRQCFKALLNCLKEGAENRPHDDLLHARPFSRLLRPVA